MSRAQMTEFVRDIWYFAGLTRDLPKSKLMRVIIAGEPICIGVNDNGDYFGMRDICPHRAAPFSAGCIKGGTVECPYHGWRFGTGDGVCREIPALTNDSAIDPSKISVRTYPVRRTGPLLWVWLAADPKASAAPAFDPPQFPLMDRAPLMDDQVQLNCHVDHAVIGLMDPAHGPFVHKQWWWRSEHSIHEKAKAFEPRERGFAMSAHRPSSNSFAYKLLGGTPITEISFQLPGIRTEEIKIGDKTVLSFTAVTPQDAHTTRIRQLFFTDHRVFKLLKPFASRGAKAFLRQDAHMVDLQAQGLAFDPALMLIDDADTQAKWYYALKRAWAKAQKSGEPFINPVKAKTLRWRS